MNKIVCSEKGSSLMLAMVIGFLVILAGAMAINTVTSANGQMKQRKTSLSAFNLAEAGKEHAVAAIKLNQSILPVNSKRTLFDRKELTGGVYTVVCSTTIHPITRAIDTVTLISTGETLLDSQTLSIMVKMVPATTSIPVNITVDALVTTRSDINVTGNISIDGRNFDLNRILKTSNSAGVFGIKSCGYITASGNAKVGGKGIAPTKTMTWGTNVQRLVSSTGYPTTPEAVLGVPVGALEQYKTATVPSNYTGILYYNGGSGGSYGPPASFTNFKGIFICHNSTHTASMKNIHGSFTGVIITDQVDHINANMSFTGAIITLSTISGTNAFGNGNADLRYSSDAINWVNSEIKVTTNSTFTIVSWAQL